MFIWVALLLINSIFAHNPHEPIFGMDVSPDGKTVLALSERNVIIRSIDGGESWHVPKKPRGFTREFTSEEHEAIGMDPHTNEALWIHYGSVAKSSNKGQNWKVISNIPSRSGTRYLPNLFGSNLIYIGDVILVRMGSDLLRSNNRGHAWDFVHNVKDCISVLHVERPGNTMTLNKNLVFVGACDGSIYVSKDAGHSWVALSDSTGSSKEAITSFSKGFPEHCGSNSFPLLIGTASGKLLVSCLDLLTLSTKNNPHLRSIHGPNTDEKKGSHKGALISQPVPDLLMLITGMQVKTLHRNDYNHLNPNNGWRGIHTSDGLYSSTGRPKSEASYNYVVPCPGYPKGRFFVGGYWGIFRSDYIAKQSIKGSLIRSLTQSKHHVPTWVKLHALTTVVTSMSVSRAIGSTNEKKPLVVVACTYAANCFITDIHTNDKSVLSSSLPKCVRYGLPALSPSFSQDGLMLISCGTSLYKVKLSKQAQRYVVKSKTEVHIPLVDNSKDHRIHSIVFSPSFGDANHNEGRTIFVSGYNIGIVRSRNGGDSFAKVWDAYGADGIDSHVSIALSPNFASDGTIAASFRGRNTPGRDLGKLPAGCTVKDVKDWTNNGCKYQNQGKGGAAIALSHDYGYSFNVVSGISDWLMYPMLVEANDNKNVIKLIAIKGDKVGVPMILEGNAASKTLNSYNWKHISGLPSDFNTADSAASAGSGHLILGSKNGDIVFGEVNTKQEKLGGMKHSRWSEFFDANQGSVKADWRRGRTSMMTLSPSFHQDGYILGGSMFSVKISKDHGTSWSKVMTINHVTTHCAHLNNCAKCRPQASEVQYPVTDDLGALCITCKEGFKKAELSRDAPEKDRYHTYATQCIRKD